MIAFIYKKEELMVFEDAINSMCRVYGKIYLHGFNSLIATIKQKKPGKFVVALDVNELILSAFEKRPGNLWQCTLNGFPFMAKNDIAEDRLHTFISDVKTHLKASTLYFPLTYVTNHLHEILMRTPHYSSWDRLPNPIISGDVNSNEIWERAMLRHKSRALRQKNKFEKTLRVKTITGTIVRDKIAMVEKKSWKSTYGQDMLSRENQIEYYSSLIESGSATVTFAINSLDEPVAFLIDTFMNNVLYIIKWSYSEEYRKYSPGFYLLCVDMPKRYDGTNVKYIDLYGSPDSLKDLLETNRLERMDFCISEDKAQVEQIKAKRMEYDKNSENTMNQAGA